MKEEKPTKVTAINLINGLTGNLEEDIEWVLSELEQAYDDGVESNS